MRERRWRPVCGLGIRMLHHRRYVGSINISRRERRRAAATACEARLSESYRARSTASFLWRRRGGEGCAAGLSADESSQTGLGRRGVNWPQMVVTDEVGSGLAAMSVSW